MSAPAPHLTSSPEASLRRMALDYLAGVPSLPLPGGGQTLERWRALAAIGAADLWLAKVLEAHFDAQAIFGELECAPLRAGQLWAVWAAEPPGIQLTFKAGEDGEGSLHGQKAWCSGADLVSHALVTARHDGQRVLCAVALDDPRMGYDTRQWQAVGMAGISSGTLTFNGTHARLIGEPGAYLSRPGFWHGGAGVAACWYGATTAIASRLRNDRKIAEQPHASAHLGVIDQLLESAAALMRELAGLIDRQRDQPHQAAVLRVRLLMDRVATEVIERVNRSLGAGPLCCEADHARRCADLATFIRQSHAERDEQQLGHLVRQAGSTWTL